MAKLVRLLAIVALVLAGVWAWHTLFPSPERVIRNRLVKISKDLSLTDGDGLLVKLNRAQAIANCLATNVTISVDIPDFGHETIDGRDDAFDLLAARSKYVTAMRVDFLDISVILNPDGETATADLAAHVSTPRDHDSFIQEVKLYFQKIGGQWLIIKIETVKTLSEWRTKSPAAAWNS